MSFELQPGARFGEYTLVRRLGGGGFGDVWLSLDSYGDPVAIKVLHGQYQSNEAARVRGEIELLAAAASAHSEHIVRVLDGGSDPAPYIVMEYIDGTDLAREIAHQGAMPVSDVLHIAEGIADALAALQRAGIIHRDIKPANVMIDRAGVVKLTDFGIAKIVGVDSATTANHMAMTVAYAAPEAFEGKVSHLSDHYAFGALLYQLLTGRMLFSGSYLEMMHQHVQNQPDMTALPMDVPPALFRLTGACLAKNASRRPSSAIALQNSIRDAINEFRTGAPLPYPGLATLDVPTRALPPVVEARAAAQVANTPATPIRPRAVNVAKTHAPSPTEIYIKSPPPSAVPTPRASESHPVRMSLIGAVAGLVVVSALGIAYALGHGTSANRPKAQAVQPSLPPVTATQTNPGFSQLLPYFPPANPAPQGPPPPEEVVRQYYTYIGAKDFPDAFNLLSTKFRAGNGVDSWRLGYQTTQAVSVQSSTPLAGTPDQVDVRFTATDLKNGSLSTNLYSGIWTLVQENGGWKLDRGVVSVVSASTGVANVGPSDLVVSRVSLTSDGHVAVTVGNRGPGTLTGKAVFVSVRDLTLRGEQLSLQVASLPVGGTVTLVSSSFKIDRETDVQAIVDPFGNLNDPDRSNNQLTSTLVPTGGFLSGR